MNEFLAKAAAAVLAGLGIALPLPHVLGGVFYALCACSLIEWRSPAKHKKGILFRVSAGLFIALIAAAAYDKISLINNYLSVQFFMGICGGMGAFAVSLFVGIEHRLQDQKDELADKLTEKITDKVKDEE
jgi:hypothetical protein